MVSKEGMTVTEQQKDFARNLIAQTNSYEEWLAVMLFGMPTLLQDQSFLIEMIMQQAEMATNSMPARLNVLIPNMVKICADLGLKFYVPTTAPRGNCQEKGGDYAAALSTEGEG